ncbi:MAG: hypothetical protein JWR70_1260, partial [Modestobacter sp.]|nr:hypothetical protein [Modestobacter sp.]
MASDVAVPRTPGAPAVDADAAGAPRA